MIPKAENLEAPSRQFKGHRDLLIHSMARYHFIAPHLSGLTLEVGCGRAYGFDVISSQTSRQVGVDLAFDFLQEARARAAALPLVCASGDRLPLADHVFDSIIAFEVIEHIQSDIDFLAELKRLASGNAFIAVSSPNRFFVSSNHKTPLNRFHAREYSADELYSLLSRSFASVTLFGQHERAAHSHPANRFLDWVPAGWKSWLPIQLQSLISVALRPPLQLAECRFEQANLDQAHTLVALCRL